MDQLTAEQAAYQAGVRAQKTAALLKTMYEDVGMDWDQKKNTPQNSRVDVTKVQELATKVQELRARYLVWLTNMSAMDSYSLKKAGIALLQTQLSFEGEVLALCQQQQAVMYVTVPGCAALPVPSPPAQDSGLLAGSLGGASSLLKWGAVVAAIGLAANMLNIYKDNRKRR